MTATQLVLISVGGILLFLSAVSTLTRIVSRNLRRKRLYGPAYKRIFGRGIFWKQVGTSHDRRNPR